MVRTLLFLISPALLFSCNFSTKKNQVATKVKDSIISPKLPEVNFLDEFSQEFILENKINEWTKFISFKESIEGISDLDPKGITFYLDELEKKTEDLLKSSKPDDFNESPIISRIKVIHMQVMKCKFYSENKQSKKLEGALKELYQYYNILLRRMISYVEEEKVIPE
jgi:hypothetical protein